MDRREFLLALTLAPSVLAHEPLAYVTADTESQVVLVGMTTGKVYRRIPTAPSPFSIERVGSHALVAHTVSVMQVQAGAARQVVRTSPDDAEASLLAVEATGREAMAELRSLLGVLGDDRAGTGPGLAPEPGVGQLEGLVDRVRAAGLPAEIEIDGQPMPPGYGQPMAMQPYGQQGMQPVDGREFFGQRIRRTVLLDLCPGNAADDLAL